MAKMAMELCDGRPSYVETHLDAFLEGYYCPWGAKLVEVHEYR